LFEGLPAPGFEFLDVFVGYADIAGFCPVCAGAEKPSAGLSFGGFVAIWPCSVCGVTQGLSEDGFG
jgi:hypothetical protein